MDASNRDQNIELTLQKLRYQNVREILNTLILKRKIPYLSSANEIEVKKIISSGSYGVVELVRYQKKLYAHKRPLHITSTSQKNILGEAVQLTEIIEYHPNIQRLHIINLHSYGFLMDYCDNGSLYDVIKNEKLEYELLDATNWAYQIADALSFLHSKGIMHRDVKIQNILLKDCFHTIILTDYGTATHIQRSQFTIGAGTPVTMAPEVYRGSNYGPQCDIFSWSIVFWQILSKNVSPYSQKDLGVIFRVATENLRPYKLKGCPKILGLLFYRSWHSVADERPTLSFIKMILRLIINSLPRKQIEHLIECDDIKTIWNNELGLAPKYLPCQPLAHVVQSANIYEDHLRKMGNISNVARKISILNEKLKQVSEENHSTYQYYLQLQEENEKLEKEISDLLEKNKNIS